MDPNTVSALFSHVPALVVGAVLAILLGFARSPQVSPLWESLPWYVQPLVLLLPVVEAVSQALLQGRSWIEAALVAALAPGVGAAWLLFAAYMPHLPHVGKVVVKPTIGVPPDA